MAGKRVLLVEGKGDGKVFEHLRKERKRSKLDEIRDCEGYSNLLNKLDTVLKGSDIGSLGVVIDADEYPSGRWQSLQNRLTKAGYTNIPKRPQREGTILDPPPIPTTLLPRVGIWIMPDNQTEGILEDFLLSLVPKESELLLHAKSSIESIPGKQLFKAVHRPKALIHTWLAWQKKPGRPFGTAIAANFLDPNVPQVDDLMDWLDRLFEEPRMDEIG